MERNLTEGSVFKNIIYFSLPYLLSYFLQTLYGMADLFIIGQFEGVASTTAVSIGSQVMHMLTVMIVGLAMGATINIYGTIGCSDGGFIPFRKRNRIHYVYAGRGTSRNRSLFKDMFPWHSFYYSL